MIIGDLFVVSVFTACTVIQKVLRAIAKQKGQKDNAHLATTGMYFFYLLRLIKGKYQILYHAFAFFLSVRDTGNGSLEGKIRIAFERLVPNHRRSCLHEWRQKLRCTTPTFRSF